QYPLAITHGMLSAATVEVKLTELGSAACLPSAKVIFNALFRLELRRSGRKSLEHRPWRNWVISVLPSSPCLRPSGWRPHGRAAPIAVGRCAYDWQSNPPATLFIRAASPQYRSPER